MGIMTESRQNTANIKLQTMVDARVACIAKNYSVDEQTKLAINAMDKQGTLSFDAPNDPLDPVFITKSGNNDKAAARREDSDDSSGDEVKRSSSLALRTKSTTSRMAEKLPGDKRVSMHST